MRLKAFSSVGGLRLYGKTDPKGPDVLMIAVHPEDLSDLAVALINQANTDASPELIAKCRELVEYVEEHNSFEPSEEQRKFIAQIEDNAGESMREGEKLKDYYLRLVADYAPSQVEDKTG